MIASLCCCCDDDLGIYRFSYSLFNIGRVTLRTHRLDNGMTGWHDYVSAENFNQVALSPNCIRIRDYSDLAKSFTIPFEPFYESVIRNTAISFYPVYDEDYYFCNYGEYVCFREIENNLANTPYTSQNSYTNVDFVFPYWVQEYGRYYEFSMVIIRYYGINSLHGYPIFNLSEIMDILKDVDTPKFAYFGDTKVSLDAAKFILAKKNISVDYIFVTYYDTEVRIAYAKI